MAPEYGKESQQTEERILEAAQRVFVRRGMAGARTQDIAEEAGVNRALINYYFRSKDKLAEAVFLRIARSLFPDLIQALGSDLPLREKLQKAIDIEFDVLMANPFMPSYILAELQYHPDRLRAFITKAIPIERVRETIFTHLQQQLDEEAAAGRIRPTRADDLMVMLISQLIFPFAAAGMLEHLLGLSEEDRAALVQRRRADLADFILRGLTP